MGNLQAGFGWHLYDLLAPSSVGGHRTVGLRQMLLLVLRPWLCPRGARLLPTPSLKGGQARAQLVWIQRGWAVRSVEQKYWAVYMPKNSCGWSGVRSLVQIQSADVYLASSDQLQLNVSGCGVFWLVLFYFRGLPCNITILPYIYMYIQLVYPVSVLDEIKII